MNRDSFLLFYLSCEDLEDNIRTIKKERSDEEGNEMWYALMLEYLVTSPYGKQHGFKDFYDIIAHFKHRQHVELRIISEIIGENAKILPAKSYQMEEILDLCP